MRTLLLATLVAASSASATPNPPTPPGPPTDNTPRVTCKASGDPIVVIDHGAIAGAKEVTSVTKLFASGAWSFAETTAEGKPGRAASGCLAKDKLATVDDAIKAGTWTITHPKMHCMAMATTFVDYVIGKTKFTQKTCGTDILDDKSSAALAEITKVLDAATAPPKVLCCKQ